MTTNQTGASNNTNPNNHSEDNNKNSNNNEQALSGGVMLELDYHAPSQVISESAISTQKTSNANKEDKENQGDTQEKSLTQAQVQEQSQHVALFAQLNRDPVSFHATVTSPLVFRDTLLALFDIVSSDYRYVPKDRSAYTVFMQMRRSNANKNLFSAQRDYFNWLFNNDPLAFCILDPIIQVHQDGVSFEVFSRDEGCYAQLTLTNDLFDINNKSANNNNAKNNSPVFGTTSIDYSKALYDGISQIRDYQHTVLDIGHEAVSLTNIKTAEDNKDSHTAKNNDKNSEVNVDINNDIDADNQVIEKRINVPKSWIRALLQVQSAGQLATDTIELDPIALYNVLFELRMHADIKGKRRGLLIELQPQQAPIIMLEPFNIAVTNDVSKSRFVYQGKQAKLIRLWGRRRLSLLKRLLPHTDSVSVSLLGQGMPSYWTLTGKGFHFTFAMTGFSQANWSQSLNFDLLLPKRPKQTQNDDLQPVLEHLKQSPSKVKQLAKVDDVTAQLATMDKKTSTSQQLTSVLLSAMQQGFVRHDMATNTYYYRPLTQIPLDMSQFSHHNESEKQAYDLSSRDDAVQKFTVENIPTKGIVISADIHVREDRRTYHSQLQLNEEGIVSKAECSCPQYLQHRLTQGVCAHLITLRLAYSNYDSSKDNKGSWHETRVLSKRMSQSPLNKSSNKLSNTLSPKPFSKQSVKPQQNFKNNPADDAKNNAGNAELVLNLSALANKTDDTNNDVTISNRTKSPAPHNMQNNTQIAMAYVTVEHKKVLIEHIVDDKTTRQQIVFNQPKQAFDAFLQHIARLEAKGFIENQGV